MRKHKNQPLPDLDNIYSPGETVLKTVHMAIINKRKALGLTRNQAYLWLILDSIQGTNESCHAGINYILGLYGGSKSDLLFNLKVLDDLGYAVVINKGPDGTVPHRVLTVRTTQPLRNILQLSPMSRKESPVIKLQKMPPVDGISNMSTYDKRIQLMHFGALFPKHLYVEADRNNYLSALRAAIDSENKSPVV